MGHQDRTSCDFSLAKPLRDPSRRLAKMLFFWSRHPRCDPDSSICVKLLNDFRGPSQEKSGFFQSLRVT